MDQILAGTPAVSDFIRAVCPVPVVLAARITEARGSEILVSALVRELTENAGEYEAIVHFEISYPTTVAR